MIFESIARRVRASAGLFGLILAAAAALNCAPDSLPPNVLILIADDVGIDMIAGFGETGAPPATPHINAIAREGVIFRNAYAAAACSPSRASILTGRYARRFGLGDRIHVRAERFELPLTELTLPEALSRAPVPYANSAVGKWHLNAFLSQTGLRHPLESGFDWYAGSVANLMVTVTRGTKGTYERWEKNVNGRLETVTKYATTDTVDDALMRVRSMPSPWLLWVAFNAAHTPVHDPPRHLHTSSPTNRRERISATIEAMDTEIGRLLAGIPQDVRARTTIIFVGDNGTPPRLSDRSDHAKGTVYEAGVRVPLMIAGPPVTRPGEVQALVHVIDIFSTVVEIAGLSLESLTDQLGRAHVLDGVSLVSYLRDPSHPPLRDTVYQDSFAPNGPGPYLRDERMIRDARYKLIRKTNGDELFFDLDGSRFEGEPVADPTGPALAAKRRLESQLESMIRELDSGR